MAPTALPTSLLAVSQKSFVHLPDRLGADGGLPRRKRQPSARLVQRNHSVHIARVSAIKKKSRKILWLRWLRWRIPSHDRFHSESGLPSVAFVPSGSDISCHVQKMSE